MRRRSFLCGVVGAGFLAAQERNRRPTLLAYVAPDGLWTCELPGGRPQRVIADAEIRSPRISPSGDWILYHRGETAFVARRDGAGGAQVGAGAAQWRQDRDEILLERPGGLNLSNAGNQWVTFSRSILNAALPVAFSPDGRELVFGERTRDNLGLLRRTSLDGAGASTLLSQSGDGFIPYRWLGDSVLYWLDPDFSASVKADGLNLYRLPLSGGRPQLLGACLVHESFLSLAPDGRLLAVTLGSGRESWDHKRIAAIDWRTGATTYLTDESTAAISPSWSPDNSRLAYVAAPAAPHLGGGEPAREALAGRRIWVAGVAPPGQAAPLTADHRFRDENPIWLSDHLLLFCRIDRGTATIWTMDDRGGGLTEIAGPLSRGNAGPGEFWFGYYGTIDWQELVCVH